MARIRFDANATQAIKASKDLAKAQEEIAKGADKSATAFGKADKEVRRFIKSAEGPQQRYNRQLAQTAELQKRGLITQKQATAAATEYRKRLDRAGKAGKSAFGDVATQSLKSFALSLAGGGGVLGAVQLINNAYQVWLKNTREIGEETKKAQTEIVAFAALQEGGTKRQRVLAAADLAARFGVTDRGQAFDTLQALQSVRGGDIKAGFRSSETVFAASQIGVPVALGKELELLGATQGQSPGQALRRAFVAGQQSARTPATLATAAPALKFFNDKDTGFAAAGVLAGTVKETELKTFVKRAGIALSKVGSAQGKFESLGLGDATQLQRLEKLSELGVDTPEELKTFGFSEIRSIEALAGLVPNVEEVKRIRSAIIKQATPGLFARERGSLEFRIAKPNIFARN